MKSAASSVAAILAVCISSPGWAQEMKPTKKFSETQIAIDPGAAFSNYTLTVTGPNGFHASASSRSEVPSIDLRRIGAFDDGTYHYQLTVSTSERVPVRDTLDNGRGGKRPETMAGSVSTSGVFQVKGGSIVKSDPGEREQTNKRQ
jgi:hypothetical protein